MTTPTEPDATRDLPRTPDGKQVVCVWLTLADLDFPDAAAASAHHLLLDALAGDVRALVAEEHLGNLDAVVLAGDTARSGQSDQYEAAIAALMGPKGGLDVAADAIYPVPGDRDVDRGRDDDGLVQYVLHAHREPRLPAHGTPWPIDEALRRDVVRDVLLTRLESYMRFADALAPTDIRGWWTRRVPARRSDAAVRLVGLNTALLCAGDDRGRLAVGRTQLADTLIGGGDAALVIGVSHHALDGPWLADAEGRVVRDAMMSRCQVLVASSAEGNRIERASTAAGEVIHLGCSLSPDADGAHGYLLAALLADDAGETSLRVWPRVTTKGGRFAADTAALEDNSARFQDLPLGLPLPSHDVPTCRSEAGREPEPEPWRRDKARMLAFVVAALDDPRAWRRAREGLPAEARAILPPTRPATADMVRHLTRLMGQRAFTPDAEPPAERLAEALVDAFGASLRGEVPDLGAPAAQPGDGLRRPRQAFFERLAALPIDLRVEFDRPLGSLDRAKEAIGRRFGRWARSRRYREGSSIITLEAPLAAAAGYWFAHRSADAEPALARDELGLRRLTWLSDDGPRALAVVEEGAPGSDAAFAPTTADRDVAALIDGLMRRESRDVHPLADLWFSRQGHDRSLLARAVRRMLPVFGDDFGRAARAVGDVAGRVERPAEAIALLARFDGTRGPDDDALRHWLMQLTGGDRRRSDRSESERASRALSGPPLLAELRALSAEAGVVVAGETLYRPAMVRIPAGSFLMGSPEDEVGRWRNEGPQHRVTLSRDFLLGATPVTAAQFEAIMGYSPYGWRDDRIPVTRVSWLDAAKYCNRLSEHEGRRPAYDFRDDDVTLIADADGYRLPSEAQWEYACRAGTSTRYWSGDTEADLARVGWYDRNSRGEPHPVAQKPPNPWGLYDMHGNVDEWTADWGAGYSADPQADPAGPPRGVFRVVRGGSFDVGARYARSAGRCWGRPAVRVHGLGFRLAAPPQLDLDLDG